MIGKFTIRDRDSERISIARDLLSPSLFGQLILFSRLMAPQSDKQTHNTGSRFGDRSYRWVLRGSTQPTGSFDSIRSLDFACYISGEGTSPLRRPLFIRLGNSYRISIGIRDRTGFAIALRNQSVGPIESRPGGRSYRVIGKLTIRGRDSEIAPTVGFRVAQPNLRVRLIGGIVETARMCSEWNQGLRMG